MKYCMALTYSASLKWWCSGLSLKEINTFLNVISPQNVSLHKHCKLYNLNPSANNIYLKQIHSIWSLEGCVPHPSATVWALPLSLLDPRLASFHVKSERATLAWVWRLHHYASQTGRKRQTCMLFWGEANEEATYFSENWKITAKREGEKREYAWVRQCLLNFTSSWTIY